ncbi:MAG TPA: type VI secretion system tip protein TssI/VgrG, partial [Minicystis sp.]|nr:type VI secretion system tip protein TssI/VgrG [Minicystis sp.]
MSLSVAGHDAFSARTFSITEALSAPFDASIVAASHASDLDLDGMVGAEASLEVDTGEGPRTWTGVVVDAELVASEEAGVSTYHVRIAPKLALLEHRAASRVYQHLSIPEIVKKVLEDFGVRVRLEIDHAAYPKHDYRVQHGEKDLDFVHRLLEEAGIAYRVDPHPEHGTQVTLTDRPHAAEPKTTVRYLENPSPDATSSYVTRLSLSRKVGSGAHTVRDHDFKKHKDVALSASAVAHGVESALGHVGFHLGAIVRHGESKAEELAKVALESARARLATASFTATTIHLAPGTVFRLADHPRPDLALDKPLLMLELAIEGSVYGDFSAHGRAAPASVPHRPERKTPRPHVSGVESAVVVGPKGESIHTDEHGRVRVQFAWDKEQGYDETSSCWVRVSQAWAGAGYGMIALPRVGQEVLVGFLGGDPDQPVVLGRVYNAENPTPYKLPEAKTKTGLRTATVPATPGESAYNEIAFEDA